MRRTWRLLGLGAAAMLAVSGCEGAVGPTPTPLIIYITATQAPVTITATNDATTTALFGPTATSDLPSWTPLPTATPLPPPTVASTLTPSFTPEFTETASPKAPTGIAQTVAAQTCANMPANGFTTLFQRDAQVSAALGCPQSQPVAISSAIEPFERGSMLWASALADQPVKTIYVLYANGSYQRYPDTWQDGVDPSDTGVSAPSGRFAPIRGFGKVWHSNPAVQHGLGFALRLDAGTSGEIERFARGEMLYVAQQNQTYIFANGTWRTDPTRF